MRGGAPGVKLKARCGEIDLRDKKGKKKKEKLQKCVCEYGEERSGGS
jgi:hypothetical protein